MSFVFVHYVLLIFLSLLSAQLICPHTPGRQVTGHRSADTALIIVAGYKSFNNQYFDIAKSIQLAFPSRLWVFIADYSQDLERVRQNLFDQGLEPGSQIYLLGNDMDEFLYARTFIQRKRCCTRLRVSVLCSICRDHDCWINNAI